MNFRIILLNVVRNADVKLGGMSIVIIKIDENQQKTSIAEKLAA